MVNPCWYTNTCVRCCFSVDDSHDGRPGQASFDASLINPVVCDQHHPYILFFLPPLQFNFKLHYIVYVNIFFLKVSITLKLVNFFINGHFLLLSILQFILDLNYKKLFLILFHFWGAFKKSSNPVPFMECQKK